MDVLLDTSIIVHSKQKTSVHYKEITDKIEGLVREGHGLYICRQVLFEFYSVATRPETANGYGYSPEQAIQEIENVMESYGLIEDTTDMENWKDIMKTYGVLGKNSHDARLVATMQANDVKNMYTKNEADFKRFADRINLV